MSANLLVCLGNPLMGDDGIGWHVAERLARVHELPGEFELRFGGTDVLKLAGEMEGRKRVVLVDAIEEDVSPGSVLIFRNGLPPPEASGRNAHRLGPVAAVRLLQATSEGLRHVDFALIGVAVGPVRFGEGLSAAVAAKLPWIVERVLEEMLPAAA